MHRGVDSKTPDSCSAKIKIAEIRNYGSVAILIDEFAPSKLTPLIVPPSEKSSISHTVPNFHSLNSSMYPIGRSRLLFTLYNERLLANAYIEGAS
ncbi:MAG: hypothetical protein CMO55_06265 [Verrucomicrobiales bacterium]|nr:hypothetical protein [Verrucomicrobiales bacterium]